MTSEEKAYIAGIIDGEGTVTLSRAHANEMPAPKVSVANNSLPLLKWIRSKANSGVIIRRARRAPHHGVQYVLDISDNAALSLLGEVSGYLIVKRPQAQLLITRYRDATPRNGRYTAEQLARKHRLVEEVRELNRLPRCVAH